MKTKRVLLVEDNLTNRLVAKAMLGKNGVDPDTATDGFEAVQKANDGQYDLILMDCMMPGMDGFEATRKIREGGGNSNANTPIVALTSNTLPGCRELCFESGMNDFISKPLQLEKLQKVLIDWTGQSVGSDEDRIHVSSFESFGQNDSRQKRIFNKESLVHNFGDSIDFLESLMISFEDSLTEQLRTIDEVMCGDKAFLELRDCTHKLRGVTGNCGAERLEIVVSELESACIAEDFERAKELYPQLVEENKLLLSVLGALDWQVEIALIQRNLS